MHISGIYGMPRRTWTYAAELNIALPNMLSTIGAFIFALSALILVYTIIKSAISGEPAGPNPWNAATLEWSIPSPPPHYNFAEIPTVRSREPLWREDERREIEAVTLKVPEVEPVMPNSSYMPIVMAFGVALTWGLVMTGKWWAPLIGLAYVGVCILVWAFEDPFSKKGS